MPILPDLLAGLASCPTSQRFQLKTTSLFRPQHAALFEDAPQLLPGRLRAGVVGVAAGPGSGEGPQTRQGLVADRLGPVGVAGRRGPFARGRGRDAALAVQLLVAQAVGLLV